MAEIFMHPGAVDLHDHFREPSPTNLSENFESGSEAALAGGFVITNDMPNTPGRPTWSEEAVLEKGSLIRRGSRIPIGIIIGAQPAADNVGELPAMLRHSIGTKYYATKTTENDQELGVDDFRDQTDELDKASRWKPIFLHPGKDNLQDFIDYIAGYKDHPLHICHVSTQQDVETAFRAKQEGMPVTMGVTPHHLFMTQHHELGMGEFARMQPPLAQQSDAEYLLWALANDIIDVVETDHAPHSIDSKMEAEHDEETDCFGVPGIEYALPLLFRLERLGKISMRRIVEVTSINPARIIGVHLSERTGVEWDMQEYRIKDDDVVSDAMWTPFAGMLAVGKVRSAKIAGKTVVSPKGPVEGYPDVVLIGKVY